MSTLLLAPFDASMCLGQGYNSFMHAPCICDAVDIKNATYIASKEGSTPSQTVSYSAEVIEKMSDFVRAMNISAGSSIRTGSVSVFGGGSSIDEMKFAESDLNAVISVKVVNETRNFQENISFKEIGVKNLDNAQFHEIYGDTFISGFIEGGVFHGIINIKSIDASKKSEIKNKLRSLFNGTNSEWSPSSSADLIEALRQADVSVTVYWSGGSMINPSNEEWNIESLIRAASAFSDKVLKCPQRTCAILTRYDTLPDFVVWSRGFSPAICVRQYDGARGFASELLDMYMEYKGNLFLLNDAIHHQDRYERSSRPDGVDMALSSLIEARTSLRFEMIKIVRKIEALDRDPEMVNDPLGKGDITAPELWRARLPFKKR
ncbi:hypothetical protein M441DRAFT_58981 [Trichoderma asperellum CBS 433.97]|uniref:Uncharacterized protein n=1 Tax=Trichoderma asperellum (strain ATCC 204424 / CBS 433.97 / NBRC 101777) TaxID=1042311 RepID=A0A2T3Z5U7_TRIA4|nr:hypothetical protein M441DRAFT_58981 [Trichoderma asperellum CBS 433.97]PTB40167.1 hypothetical protein M441DRAFT_58981 [Trichoderma asperellum CBS 433.97]